MFQTIHDLVKNYNLSLLADTQAVRREGNAYALNAEGKICALSFSSPDNNLESLILDKSADGLVHLHLNDNKKLREVQFEVPLPLLWQIYLSRCALTTLELPPGCAALEKMYVNGNQLNTLQFKGDCPKLEFLDASDNQLTDFNLPAGFEKLAYLYLNNNKLEHLSFPDDLPELSILHLRANQLKELPRGKYAKLETLYVRENPLSGHEESVIQGDDSGNALELIGILRAAFRTGERPNYRAKLIVVGNGRIGKTCLVNRLLDLPCADDQTFTHGISIQHLHKINLPGIKTPELDLQVWDFGGQDVYFATHQFFLSEEASYVYAWTDRAIARQNREKDKQRSPAMYDDKWQRHDYWLDNIRMHGQKSPILIVKTHCLESKEVLPFDALKDRYDLSYAPLDFDAKSLEASYLVRLKKELTEALNSLPLLGSLIPNSYDDVIAAIRRRKDEGAYKLFKPEFFELATTNKIIETDLDNLLGYLKKTGEIIYFPDNPNLKDRIFIDPQSLIQKVYKLLENNDFLLREEGYFTAEYAKEKLGWADWDELLELLTSFKLVFERKSLKTYISPQYLPPLPKSGNAFDTFEGLKEDRKLRFFLRYPGFLPDNVMVNVLSEYGPYARETVYRNGIFFRKEGATEACVIVCDEAEQCISVYTNENEAADQVAKDVFEQFMAKSKKAPVHLSVNSEGWLDARVAREAFEKDKDIPLIGGGWVENKEPLAFLFGERNREFMLKQGLNLQEPLIPSLDKIEPIRPPVKPDTKMSATTRNLIIAGIFIIIILLLPIWGDGRGGKISILGDLFKIEIGEKNDRKPTPPLEVAKQPETQKVSVTGRVSINNQVPLPNQIMQVSIKDNNRVNPTSLSGDQFTLRNVEIPADKQLAIEFVLANREKGSRIFNVSDIQNGLCDIGEIRIVVEKPVPKKGGGYAPPVINIYNNNIIQSQNQPNGQ